MKRLTYQLLTTVNRGSEEEPVAVDILTDCEIICPDDDLDANLAIAQVEAYNGEVAVEDCAEAAAPLSNSQRIEELEELVAGLLYGGGEAV